ncbi:MAG: hypothetical protein KDK48_04355 [Chlamydiia bacterium]|nr:hypothetical protein [Chlamydiia bacterium]
MEFEERLTNDSLKKKFDSQFELVNYLIKQARGMIRSGRAPRVNVDSDNTAVNVVAELVAGKDLLDDEPSFDLDVNIEETEVFTS